MNLRKQLRVELREHEQLVEEKRKEEEKKLIRSPEDWNIVEEYLRNLLIELSAKPYTKIGFSRKNFIRIDFYSPRLFHPCDNANKDILLANGSKLDITHKDMQRFCKQHKLKLKYVLDKNHDFAFSNRYIELQVSSYLIGV